MNFATVRDVSSWYPDGLHEALIDIPDRSN